MKFNSSLIFEEYSFDYASCSFCEIEYKTEELIIDTRREVSKGYFVCKNCMNTLNLINPINKNDNF